MTLACYGALEIVGVIIIIIQRRVLMHLVTFSNYPAIEPIS